MKTIANLIADMQSSLNMPTDYVDDSDELLSCKEVAEYLGMHIGSIYKIISSGKLRAYNLSSGGSKTYYRIKKVDLDNYLEERYCCVR